MPNLDDTYDVYCYASGDRLEGSPERDLVRQSEDAAPTGAVPAWYDREQAVWLYVAPSDVARWETRGDRVRTVYVQPCAE